MDRSLHKIDDLILRIYDTALDPAAWPAVLEGLGSTFRCHFADVFGRTEDRSRFQGVAYGLSESDYQDNFLGVWTKRNVWASKHPTTEAGEIVTTSEIVSRRELQRSEMFNDYLQARDLHEGLRLSIWSGDGWVNDISLIRAWSVGSFTSEERALAHQLMPHLRQAASLAHRGSGTMLASGLTGADCLHGIDQPALLVDAGGTVLHSNAAAEGLLAAGSPLRLLHGQVVAGNPGDTAALLNAIARAGTVESPTGAEIRLRDATGGEVHFVAWPASERRVWPIPAERATLLLATTPEAGEAWSEQDLAERFQLTRAEAAVAALIAAGQTVDAISGSTGRSRNTVRTHLSRLMEKTDTNRQADLVRVLTRRPPALRTPVLPHPAPLHTAKRVPS